MAFNASVSSYFGVDSHCEPASSLRFRILAALFGSSSFPLCLFMSAPQQFREFWNDRYREKGFAYGTEPNDFIKAQAHLIPPGRVLCLAEGQGRNAVYLAKLGYAVTAVDLSPIGLQKAQELAAEHGVSIGTQAVDLAEFQIEPDTWQGIISIFAHVSPVVRNHIHRQVVTGLAPGGIFILEAYTPGQLETRGVGGPRREHADKLMSLVDLQNELAGLTLLHAKEMEREVVEGRFHSGVSAVVQIVARREA
jgi:SAM-dependent methyltransferase